MILDQCFRLRDPSVESANEAWCADLTYIPRPVLDIEAGDERTAEGVIEVTTAEDEKRVATLP